MPNFSASIPLADADAANTVLEAMGFGPGNFGVPGVSDEDAPDAFTLAFAGLHCWHHPEFRAALVTLQATYPALLITDSTNGEPNFDAHKRIALGVAGPKI
jgi:hypothetical protein